MIFGVGVFFSSIVFFFSTNFNWIVWEFTSPSQYSVVHKLSQQYQIYFKQQEDYNFVYNYIQLNLLTFRTFYLWILAKSETHSQTQTFTKHNENDGTQQKKSNNEKWINKKKKWTELDAKQWLCQRFENTPVFVGVAQNSCTISVIQAIWKMLSQWRTHFWCLKLYKFRELYSAICVFCLCEQNWIWICLICLCVYV